LKKGSFHNHPAGAFAHHVENKIVAVESIPCECNKLLAVSNGSGIGTQTRENSVGFSTVKRGACGLGYFPRSYLIPFSRHGSSLEKDAFLTTNHTNLTNR
jgi:hypothetical protein